MKTKLIKKKRSKLDYEERLKEREEEIWKWERKKDHDKNKIN